MSGDVVRAMLKVCVCVEGVCDVEGSWDGDKCNQPLSIRVAITVPSLNVVTIAIEVDGDSGASKNVVMSAGSAIEVVFPPIVTALTSMVFDIIVEMGYCPLLTRQTSINTVHNVVHSKGQVH